MKVIVAPDAFKGCLTTEEVADCLAAGVADTCPEATIDTIPLSDGGPGMMRAVTRALRGEFRTAQVSGPLGEPIEATWGYIPATATAVIEMAAASGLDLVPTEQRDPRRASTRGTGELIRSALDTGARRIILGIGGSATNDGGAGFAQALGARLLDSEEEELPPGGAALRHLARIDVSPVDPRLAKVAFEVACDVNNPLLGPQGASAIYGPQKGATPAMVTELDAALTVWANRIASELGRDVANLPGAGAAGGLGAGLLALTNAKLVPGIDLVTETVGLADRMRGASLCLTGEGSLDSQSWRGKTVSGVGRIAHGAGVPAVAIVGGYIGEAGSIGEIGLKAVFAIQPGPASVETSMANAAAWIRRTARMVAALHLASRSQRGD